MGSPNSAALEELAILLLQREPVDDFHLQSAGVDIVFLRAVYKQVCKTLPYLRGFRPLKDWYPGNMHEEPTLMLGKVAHLYIIGHSGHTYVGAIYISREGRWVLVWDDSSPHLRTFSDDRLTELVEQLKQLKYIISSPHLLPGEGSGVCPAVQVAACLREMVRYSHDRLMQDAAKMGGAKDKLDHLFAIFG
ncbi:MAG: hypothetical protein WAU02_03140 [Candidatus Saccharimonadales bacterium]